MTYETEDGRKATILGATGTQPFDSLWGDIDGERMKWNVGTGEPLWGDPGGRLTHVAILEGWGLYHAFRGPWS